jgi:lactoylglutathione lyase
MSLSKLSSKKLTPNLIVSNVDASLRFYEDVLGFDRSMVFPEQPPFAFASVTSGPVKIFLSDRSTVTTESPQMTDVAFGGGNIMFIEVEGVDDVHARIAPLVTVVMSLRTQWFGIREFAIQDPDGYVVTFAERVAEPPRRG